MRRRDKITDYLRNTYHKIYDSTGRQLFFLEHRKNSFNISKSKLRRARRLGMTPDEYVAYNLDVNNPGDYLTIYERHAFRKKLGALKLILDRKDICYSLFGNVLPMNEMVLSKTDGTPHYFNECEDVMEVLRKDGRLVYKRISGGGGEKFHLFGYDEEKEEYSINLQPADEAQICELLSGTDGYIIEKYCHQSNFENSIFPYSVNTIRAVTVIHKDGSYELVGALHRFGVDTHSCVDNAHTGGIFAEIDLDTGIMSAARTINPALMLDDNGEIKEYPEHPVTAAQIEGVTIPNWDEVRKQAIEFHKAVAYTGLKFIAWDFAMTDEGIKVIEMNASCGAMLFQTREGQRNKALGNWFREWGYIH